MSLVTKLVLATLPAIPRPLMRRLSARYIAGESLAEALERLRELRGQGYSGILDILGEDVADRAAARAVARDYCAAASAIAEAELDAYPSIKPTHFGLRLGEELAQELIGELCAHCRELDLLVRVEMEDHTTTDATLRIFGRLRERFDNVGIVLQSRLRRTPRDIDELPEGPVDVRLVKGVYLEPEEIAHTGRQEIRDAFVENAEHLLQRGHRIAFATHDEHLAARLLRLASDRGVDRGRYYFEVLLGVQERLWKMWSAAGHEVRVYVPFGPEWRAYSQRRLKSNPEILRHVMRNVLR